MHRFTLPSFINKATLSSSATGQLASQALVRSERIKAMAIGELASLLHHHPTLPSQNNKPASASEMSKSPISIINNNLPKRKPLLETCQRSFATLERCGALPRSFGANAPFLALESDEALLLLDTCSCHPQELQKTAEAIFEAYRFAVLERPRGTYNSEDIRRVAVRAMQVCSVPVAVKIFLRDIVAFNNNSNNNINSNEISSESSNPSERGNTARAILDFLDELLLAKNAAMDEIPKSTNKNDNTIAADRYLSVLFEGNAKNNNNINDDKSDDDEITSIMSESNNIIIAPASQFLLLLAENADFRQLLPDFARIFAAYLVTAKLNIVVATTTTTSQKSGIETNNNNNALSLENQSFLDSSLSALLSPALSICLSSQSNPSLTENATRLLHVISLFSQSPNSIDLCLQNALKINSNNKTSTRINVLESNSATASPTLDQAVQVLETHANVADFIMTAFSSSAAATKYCADVLKIAAQSCFTMTSSHNNNLKSSSGRTKETENEDDDDLHSFLFAEDENEIGDVTKQNQKNYDLHHHYQYHHNHFNNDCPLVQANRMTAAAYSITRALVKHHNRNNKISSTSSKISRRNDFVDMELTHRNNEKNESDDINNKNSQSASPPKTPFSISCASAMCAITAASTQFTATVEFCCSVGLKAFEQEMENLRGNKRNSSISESQQEFLSLVKEMVTCLSLASVAAATLNSHHHCRQVQETIDKVYDLITTTTTATSAAAASPSITSQGEDFFHERLLVKTKHHLNVLWSRVLASQWLMEKMKIETDSEKGGRIDLQQQEHPLLQKRFREEDSALAFPSHAISSILGLYAILMIERSSEIAPNPTILENLMKSTKSTNKEDGEQKLLLKSQIVHLLRGVLKKFGDGDSSLAATIVNEIMMKDNNSNSNNNNILDLNNITHFNLKNENEKSEPSFFISWPSITSTASSHVTVQDLAQGCVQLLDKMQIHSSPSSESESFLFLDTCTAAFLLDSIVLQLQQKPSNEGREAKELRNIKIVVCSLSADVGSANSLLGEMPELRALKTFEKIVLLYPETKLIGRLNKVERSEVNDDDEVEVGNSNFTSSLSPTASPSWWQRHLHHFPELFNNQSRKIVPTSDAAVLSLTIGNSRTNEKNNSPLSQLKFEKGETKINNNDLNSTSKTSRDAFGKLASIFGNPNNNNNSNNRHSSAMKNKSISRGSSQSTSLLSQPLGKGPKKMMTGILNK